MCWCHSTKNLRCSHNVNNLTKRLNRTIGYTFDDGDLLALALTHRSVSGTHNNERLEFLGDSILNFVIGEALFSQFDKAREGQLSRLRAALVKGDTLAEIALAWDLGQHLNLGSGELKSGGFRRESILADTVEAIIGGIYLDKGMEAAKERILAWYQDRLSKLSLDQVSKDPKTRLQEYLQSRKLALPNYSVASVSGDPHDQHFRVYCLLDNRTEPFVGEGGSRRAAEQQAAKAALIDLGVSKGKKHGHK